MFTWNMETSLLTPRSTKFGGKHGTNVKKKLRETWRLMTLQTKRWSLNWFPAKVHQHAEMYPNLYAAECCFIEGSMNIPWTTNDVYLLATSSRFVHLELQTISIQRFCLKYPTHNEEKKYRFWNPTSCQYSILTWHVSHTILMHQRMTQMPIVNCQDFLKSDDMWHPFNYQL